MTSALASLTRRLAAALGVSRNPIHMVGGVVRDLLLARGPRDLDLLVETEAGLRPGICRALGATAGMEPVVFRRRPPFAYRIVVEGIVVDTSFCEPGRLAEALLRRDFTINAMAVPLTAASRILDEAAGAAPDPARFRALIVDPLGGLADLDAGRIAAAAPDSIDDDPLRMLRAVRLEATLTGFRIATDLAAMIRTGAARIREAAAERIAAEIDLILLASGAGPALRRMDLFGLLTPILPELEPLRGLPQPPRHHDHDALGHTLLAVEEADRLARGCDDLAVGPLTAEETLILKWAALLHDAGKAATASVDPDGARHFYGHEVVSATLAEEAMRRLRLPSRIARPAARLVAMHLKMGALASTKAGERPVRRLARAAGDLLPLLALLSLADRRASGGEQPGAREAALLEVARHALRSRPQVEAIAKEPPLLDGRDVMSILGIPSGRRVGSILRWIDRLRGEGRLTTRDQAVALLRSLPPPRFR